MTSGFSPAVARLDPDQGATADFWDRLLAGTSRPGAMLLLADAAARASGWGARAALTLADALAQRYGSAVLVDLQLDQPALHRVAGLRNEEGIVDALLFGASVEHVALPVAGGVARVVTAGAFVPSAEAVLDSGDWSRFIEEATATGGGLLLYAPLEGPLGSLPERVERGVLLRGTSDGDGPAPPSGLQLVCVVTPPPPRAARPGPEPEPEPGSLPPTDDAPPQETPIEAGAAAGERALGGGVEPIARERDALISDLRARQQAGLAASRVPSEPRRPVVAGASASQDAGTRQPLADPPPAARVVAEVTPRRRPVLVVTLVLLVLVAALAGFWHYFGRDYFAAGTPAPSEAAANEPRPAGDPLPYSVAIEAHQDLPTATTRAAALATAEPAIGFYIAPILVDSVLYYRILAGPVRDSATAAVIMDTLIARGHKTGSSEWDIRSTPLTFLLDEFATRDEAVFRMDELSRLDIPSYVVEMPYSTGPARFRLYSGAYAGPAEADVMRQFLESVGLADTLVLRTGRSAS